jgi:TM2 domain-containing membrane protein YozV
MENRPAAGWPVERRLLYELQRACLAVERTNYPVDVFEWVRTFGRRPLKRPLPKTKWVDAHLRLRAALLYARRLSGGHEVLDRLLADAVHLSESRARNDLRPDVAAVLDDVGLVPESAPERRSHERLVEELLDGACARGFFRIGDLRDAIARNRVKLHDLSGPGELVRGDPLIRANELLPLRLDGVYRRGEVYMRLLQRGCSVFFGTRVGRWVSMYVALPFGGAFILLEAIGHLYGAGKGLVHWLTGWTAAVNGVSLLGGGMAGTLAGNPTLDPGGVSREAVLAVGIFLLLLIHRPAFRSRVARAARFAFVKVPRAVRRSPLVYQLVHNRATRLLRRYLLLPLAAGGTAALAATVAGADAASVSLVGVGAALLAGTFFRTPFGREVEDRFDETVERIWRVVSVNFVVGILTWILHFFRAVFEAIDRGLHAVDEGLRFREGQGRAAFAFKLVFGSGWFVFTYLFRFAWTLLVEPQVNPIKHFPVVTVSHKVLLPLIPPLAGQFGVTKQTMATIVFGIPGIFGFLVWELRENWKLYRANAPKDVRPVRVGSHGETVRGLLRPGFHSGTVPKAFAKLRRAVRAGNRAREARQRHAIDHAREALERFAERNFLAYLRTSTRWGREPVALGHLVLAPNRIVIPVTVGVGREPVQVALEERHGWVIGSVPEDGGLRAVRPQQRSAFADALLGLYKRAGVLLVREQVAAVFGPQAYAFDAVPEGLVIPLPDGTEHVFDYEDGPEIELPDRRLPTHAVVLSDRPLPWADWAARWDADAAGKAPADPLIPGWTVLPATSAGGSTEPPR